MIPFPIAASASTQPVEEKKIPKLRFYLMSDTHGADVNLAKLATTIERDLDTHPDVMPIFVHAGDFVGTNKLLSSVESSEHHQGGFDIAAFKVIADMIHKREGQLFFVPGNHDVLYTVAQLKKFVKESQCTAVVSNAKFPSELSETFKAIAVQKICDQTIGIVGLMTPETIRSQNNVFDFSPCLDAKKKFSLDSIVDCIVGELSALIVIPSRIVIMSHLGAQEDRKLAAKLTQKPALKNIHSIVILGGHSHEVVTEEVDGILLANGGAYAEYCVVFDPQSNGFSVLNSEQHQPHEGIKKIIEAYQSRLNIVDLNTVLFRADSTLGGLEVYSDSKGYVRVSDCFLSRLAADALANCTQSDFAFIPAAEIRVTGITKGQIVTKADLLESYYLGENRVVKIKVTGRMICDAIELGVLSGYNHYDARSLLLQPSKEVKYAYDTTPRSTTDIPPCVDSAKILVYGASIDLEKEYTIAVTQWMLDQKLFPDAKVERRFKDPVGEMAYQYFQKNLSAKNFSERFGERVLAGYSFEQQKEQAGKTERMSADRRYVAIMRKISSRIAVENGSTEALLSEGFFACQRSASSVDKDNSEEERSMYSSGFVA